MKEIPLSQGFVALVDDADYDLVGPYRWHARKSKYSAYARRSLGKYDVEEMHKLLTGWDLVDHRDGNGLNNQRDNLRPATAAQNLFNIRAQTGKTSRFKGVSRCQRIGKPWQVCVGFEGRQVFQGCYADEIEAALAYDRGARELHGTFATLNFPGPGEQSAHRPTQVGAA